MTNVAILICIVFTSTQLWVVNARPLLSEASSMSEFMTALIKEFAKTNIQGASMMDSEVSEPPSDEEMINERVDVEELLKQKVYGDIVLTPEQEKFLITDREPSLVQGFFNGANKWPNATVPYVLDSAFNSRLNFWVKRAIKRAIKQLDENSCINFVERTSTNQGTYSDYVSFERSLPGCWSHLGMIGGKQTINIGPGCGYKGIVQHEIFHALGRIHEHSRPDRDTFVRIHYGNIKIGKKHNFSKMNADTKGLQYDYGSIMHYSLYGFSKNRKPTMSVLNPTTERVGQRKDPSNFDRQWLNTVYCTAG